MQDEYAATILNFYRAMDQHDAEAAASFFTHDALWIRRGQSLQGRTAILTALKARQASMRTAHVVTNFLLDQGDGVTRSCHYYLTAYLSEETDGDEVAKPQLPFQLALMAVDTRRENHVLQIAAMKPVHQVFMR